MSTIREITTISLSYDSSNEFVKQNNLKESPKITQDRTNFISEASFFIRLIEKRKRKKESDL